VDHVGSGDITAVSAGPGLSGGGASGNVTLALDAAFTDERYWGMDGNSGTNAATQFIGTTDNLPLTLRVNNIPAQSLIPAMYEGEFVPSVVHGAAANQIAPGVAGAVIGGGGSTGSARNQVLDHFGVVGGGMENQAGSNGSDPADAEFATVGGGHDNEALSNGSTIAGGAFNHAEGSASAIGGGEGNAVFSNRATIAGGQSNSANAGSVAIGGGSFNYAYGEFSTIPGGADAETRLYGQMAYANGGFRNEFSQPIAGSAQMSVYVLRNTIAAGGALVPLYLDGASQRLVIDDGRTVAFEFYIAVRNADGDSAGYRYFGVIENVANDLTFIAAPSGQFLGEDPDLVSVAVTVLANDSTGALDIFITNGSASAIRAVAVVNTTEVTY
jgi:hypothetical protein